MYFIDTASAQFVAVVAAAAELVNNLDPTQEYVIVSTTNAYIKQSDAGTAASAADGSSLLPAGVPMLLDGIAGDTVSIIRVTADGVATISKIERP